MAELTRPELRVELQFFCGCGDPEGAADALLEILDLHPLYDHQEEFKRLFPTNWGQRYLVLYMLDEVTRAWRKDKREGWFEHGGSVGGQWLTDKGNAVRDALHREKEADNFEGLFPDGGHCVHGFAENDEGYEAHDCMAADRASEPREGT